eukprot:997637-Ditylum_brightwellii.AAC.1
MDMLASDNKESKDSSMEELEEKVKETWIFSRAMQKRINFQSICSKGPKCIKTQQEQEEK